MEYISLADLLGVIVGGILWVAFIINFIIAIGAERDKGKYAAQTVSLFILLYLFYK
jgi:hypothetical protein